ncbi:unnamed protein product [Mytilus coruscus]|uniref:ABC transmembrane type-1 domain-containing protein n=1 Tax=Mytilus coruscus TaxID=42192 RepID=A0A6J8E5L9_MYTCO|nr:unnamed protein product [Mytilus coruscus]
MDSETGFCDSPFLALNETWNTVDPDFSPCFQKTVILWIPCAILVLGTPIRIFQLSKSQVPALPFTWLNIGKTNPCPEERSSFLSRLIFWWFNPMVIQGYKRDIKRENLWALNHEDNSSSVFPRFEKYWKKEEERVEKLLIQFTKDKGEYEWRGYLYSVLMFLVAVVQSLILHQYFHGAQLVGMRLRTSIIAAVYNKASVSLKRIQTFLNNDELDYSAFSRDINAKHAITIEKGIFSWEKESTATLKELSIEIPDGSLVAVVGQVGCGKSSLLSAILGEMDTISGKVNVKTRILVTHGISFLSKVDIIITLVDGKISEMGSYSDLISHAGAFAEFLKNYLNEELEKEDLEDEIEDLQIAEDMVNKLKNVMDDNKTNLLKQQVSVLSQRTRTESEMSEGQKSDILGSSWKGSQGLLNQKMAPKKQKSVIAADTETLKLKKQVKEKKKEEKLIQAEGVETGKVKLNVFMAYLRSVGLLLSLLIIFFYILYNAASIYSNIWLAEWSNDNTTVVNGTIDTAQRDLRLGIYGVIGFIQGGAVFAIGCTVNLAGVYAGKILHRNLLTTILAAPALFFDTTPVGRILNRFAHDTDVVDINLPRNFRSWFFQFLKTLTIPIVVGYSTPLFLTTIPPAVIVYYIAQIISDEFRLASVCISWIKCHVKM